MAESKARKKTAAKGKTRAKPYASMTRKKGGDKEIKLQFS